MISQQRGGLPVFEGYSTSQYGAGLGNVIGGAIRGVLPFLAPTIKRLGKGLVKMGADRLIGAIDGVGAGSSRQSATPAPRSKKLKRKPRPRPGSVRRFKRTKRDILS